MDRLDSIILDRLKPLAFVPRESGIWDQQIELQSKAFYKLLGPSGSGKTSLFAFLCGMRTDYSGQIRVKFPNQSLILAALDEQQWAQLRKRHFSLIFQDLRLIGEITLRENLRLKTNLLSEHGSTKNERILEFCAHLEIDHLLNRCPNTFSRGELQRGAIIRALLQPFDFIFLDEPFSHLDKRLRSVALELIHSECQNQEAGALFFDLHEDDLLPYQEIFHFGRAV